MEALAVKGPQAAVCQGSLLCCSMQGVMQLQGFVTPCVPGASAGCRGCSLPPSLTLWLVAAGWGSRGPQAEPPSVQEFFPALLGSPDPSGGAASSSVGLAGEGAWWDHRSSAVVLCV